MDHEQQAIQWLRLGSEMSFAYYERPLLLCYSGGKDSDVVLELARRSGIPFEIQHSHTTVDAPQTVRHVRTVFYELECQGYKPVMNYPRTSMWKLIPVKLMPPTRVARYCCSILKETAGKNRMICTGVRKYESRSRFERGVIDAIHKKKACRIAYIPENEPQTVLTGTVFMNNDNDPKRKLIEHCQKKNKSACNPIIELTDFMIWDFIRSEHVQINPLYEMGFDRVGCIGCPVAGDKRWREFQVFPRYKTAYIHAFDRMIKMQSGASWKTGEEVFRWWMEEKNLDGQIGFLGDEPCKL